MSGQVPSEGSGTPMSATAETLSNEWPMERVIRWLQDNGFSRDWQDTFRKLNLRGPSFLEIGKGHGGKGHLRMVHEVVLPELAKQCTQSGTGWDQAREQVEGRRLRKLVRDLRSTSTGRDTNQLASASTDDMSHEPLQFPDAAAFVPFSMSGDEKSPDIAPPPRTSSPGSAAPSLRPKASGDFDKQIQYLSSDKPSGASSRPPVIDDHGPKVLPDESNRLAHKANSSRDAGSPALVPEPSPRLDSRSMHSRESSSQRSSAYFQGRTTPSGTYPGTSNAPKGRYYGGSHQRNVSSETHVPIPRSATEGTRPWADQLSQDGQHRPASGESNGRHASIIDSGSVPKDHRTNIFGKLFNRKKDDGHPSPDELQAHSPSSPGIAFKLPSFSHKQQSESMERSSSKTDYNDHGSAISSSTTLAQHDQRRFVFVTPDGWNYRLVNVSTVDTVSQLRSVLSKELSLPDTRDLEVCITQPGQQDHEESVSDYLLQQALARADAFASLKLFIKTPYNVALPTGTQQSFPTSAKLEPFPPLLAPVPKGLDQTTYDQLNSGSNSVSPVIGRKPVTPSSNVDSFAAREAARIEADDKPPSAETYRQEVQAKAKAYRDSKQIRPDRSPIDDANGNLLKRPLVDFDNPRRSPFENTFADTLEPRRRPPPVPPATTTLKLADSLKRSAREESRLSSSSDPASSSPKRKGTDELARDVSVRGRRRAIADPAGGVSGVAGALVGATRVAAMAGAPQISSETSFSRTDSARPDSAKSDAKDSPKDFKRALASVNFGDSLAGRQSPNGSPRSPGITMSKGNVPFKLPIYEEDQDLSSSSPQRPRRVTPEVLPNRLLTDLKQPPQASPDVSPSTHHPPAKVTLSKKTPGSIKPPLNRNSTRRGPQIDFKEEKVSFNRAPLAETQISEGEDDDSDDGLFAMPLDAGKEVNSGKKEVTTISRSSTPSLQSEPSPLAIRPKRSASNMGEAVPFPASTALEPVPELGNIPRDATNDIRRRPLQSAAERAAKQGRRNSFISDGWAARPAPEALVERLDEFFPEVDLDQPSLLVDGNEAAGKRGDDGHDAYEGSGLDAGDEHANNEAGGLADKKPMNLTSVAQKNIRKSGGLGRTKSIRDVVKGAYKTPPSKPNSINPRLSTVKNDNMLRRRSTKMFGAKIEQIKPPRGSRLIHLETIPQDTITQDSIDVPQRQRTFKWVKGELIGKGSFGKVYLGMNTTTGEILAVKQVEVNPKTAGSDKDKIKEMVKSLDSEIDTMQHLDHGNIVQYLGCERKEYSISIFLEYISGGSIGSCLRKHGKFEESVVASCTRQTLCGLKYLHDQGVLHRDLKADNILLDMDGTCKISDFGISKKSDNIYGNDASNSMQGSVFWMAPEVVRSQGSGYSAKVDIWSLGCVVLEMFSGKRPWYKEEVIGAIYKLGTVNEAPPIPDADTIDPAALSFMYDCFNV